MGENVQALKTLYVAMGGTASDVANISQTADMIVEISKIVSSTGIELPKVTSADNGNVLTVVNGAWAKAAVPVELPAVSAEDNGDVLKVVDGVWAVGTDEIQA